MDSRSGTENVLGIIAFAAALEEADKELKNGEWERVREIRDLLEDILLDEVKDIVIFGREVERLPNTSYFACVRLEKRASNHKSRSIGFCNFSRVCLFLRKVAVKWSSGSYGCFAPTCILCHTGFTGTSY